MSKLKKETYYKNGEGFIMNTFYKDGDKVELFKKQAKYLVAPLGTELRLKKDRLEKAKPAPASVPAPVKQLPPPAKAQAGKSAGK